MQQKKINDSISLKVISCLLGSIQVLVWKYSHGGTISVLNASMVFAIASVLFWISGCLLYKLLSSGKDLPADKRIFAENRNTVFYSLLLLAFWSVHLIAYFPGGLCPDTVWQIQQGVTKVYITTHHPVFDSLLMAAFVQAGIKAGNADAGLAAFVIVQALYGAFVLGYTLKTMQDYHAKRWMILLSFLIYALMPEFTGFINVAIKDTLFSLSFVLMETVMIRIQIEGYQYLAHWKHKLLWMIGALGILLLRNNGIYVFVITMIVDILASVIHKMKPVRTIFLFAIPLICSMALNVFIDYRYHPVDDDPYASALCLPLQQTGRYIRDYGNEVTFEERKAISAVLEYDKIADAYTPSSADPMKAIFKSSEASREDVTGYLKTWLQMSMKHPGNAFDATAEQNYYLFDIYACHNDYYNDMTELEYDRDYGDICLSDTKLTVNEQLASRQDAWRQNVYDRIDNIPVLNLFDNMAFWNVMLFCMLSYMIFTKQKDHILYLVPLFVSLLICIASPVIVYQQRYAFPIVYSMPFIISAFFRKREPYEK